MASNLGRHGGELEGFNHVVPIWRAKNSDLGDPSLRKTLVTPKALKKEREIATLTVLWVDCVVSSRDERDSRSTRNGEFDRSATGGVG